MVPKGALAYYPATSCVFNISSYRRTNGTLMFGLMVSRFLESGVLLAGASKRNWLDEV